MTAPPAQPHREPRLIDRLVERLTQLLAPGRRPAPALVPVPVRPKGYRR